MKKIILVSAFAIGMVASASAQFRSGSPVVTTVVSTPYTVTTAATSNLTTAVKIGQNGFAVTGYFAAASAASSNVNVQAYVSHNGTDYSTAPIVLGNFTANGTTAVRGTVFVPASTIGNVSSVKLVLTNQNAASVIVSNLAVSSF